MAAHLKVINGARFQEELKLIASSASVKVVGRKIDSVKPFKDFNPSGKSRKASQDWVGMKSIFDDAEAAHTETIDMLKSVKNNTEDQSLLRQVKDRCLSYDKLFRSEKHLAHIVFYDLVTVAAYKKCLHDVLKAKGKLNDDEEVINKSVLAMSELLMDFPKKQRSTYTAQVFASLVKEMKSVLSDREYKEIQDTCKYFKHENEENN